MLVADVVFHQFSHEAIDRTACGRRGAGGHRTGIIFIKGAQSNFELAMTFLVRLTRSIFAGKCATFCLST